METSITQSHDAFFFAAGTGESSIAPAGGPDEAGHKKKNAWKDMGYIRLIYMGLYGMLRIIWDVTDYMGLYGITCDYMGLHGIICIIWAMWVSINGGSPSSLDDGLFHGKSHWNG